MRANSMFQLVFGGLLLFAVCFSFGVALELIRDDSGDIFTNPDANCAADSCRKYEGNDIFGIYKDKCKCACNGDKSTYIINDRVCADRKYMETKLDKAECVYRLGTSCHSSKIPLIDTHRRGLAIISNCASPTSNVNNGNHIQCSLNPSKAFYYDQGIWFLLPYKQNIFYVEVSSNQDIYLKWSAGLDKRYQGRIISLEISCRLIRLIDSVEVASTQQSSQGGSYAAMKPCLTFKTTGKIAVAVVGNNETTNPTTTEQTKLTPATTKHRFKFSNATSTNKNTTLPSGEDDKETKSRFVAIFAATISSLVGVTLALVIGFVIIYRRKKRNQSIGSNRDSKETVGNPSYERGPDPELKVCNPAKPRKPIQNSSLTKQTSLYQPLVQNTRPRCLTAPTLHHGLNNEKCNACAAAYRKSILVDNGEYAALNKHTMDQYGLETTRISRAFAKGETGCDYHDYQEIDEVVYAKPGFYSKSRRRHSTYDNVPNTLEHEQCRHSVVAYAVAEPRMYLHSPRERNDRDYCVFRQDDPQNPCLEEETGYYGFKPDPQSPTYWVLTPGIKSPAFVFETNEVAI